jgi:hypothetical protein
MARLKTNGGLYLDRKGGKGQKLSFFSAAEVGKMLISGSHRFSKAKTDVLLEKSVSTGSVFLITGGQKPAPEEALGGLNADFLPYFPMLGN